MPPSRNNRATSDAARAKAREAGYELSEDDPLGTNSSSTTTTTASTAATTTTTTTTSSATATSSTAAAEQPREPQPVAAQSWLRRYQENPTAIAIPDHIEDSPPQQPSSQSNPSEDNANGTYVWDDKDLEDPAPPTEALPTYREATGITPTPFFGPPLIMSIIDNNGANGTDEIYVEGMPVGSIYLMLINALVSGVVQVVGFMLCFLLARTHAARCGAYLGLGATMLQYGFSIRGNVLRDMQRDSQTGIDLTTGKPATPTVPPVVSGGGNNMNPAEMLNDPNGPASESDALHNGFLAYILIILGWLLIIRALLDYIRLRRLEAIIMTQSSAPTGANAV
ncbi:hypothetical protein GQ42DRAFT_178572 [Ramicandelaber brevisporus]|nr:hypothetical protein GQ42DRAFT_178572 [Ramicandelaber brevisporus]